MNAPPSLILQQLLITPEDSDDEPLFNDPEGSEADSWPLFMTSLPSEPDCAACIYDTAGVPHGRLQKTGEPQQHYGVQVRVRANDYATGWSKAEAVRQLLSAVAQQEVVVDEVTYKVLSVSPTSTVVPLGVNDETGRRDEFTVNFLTAIVEA